MCKENVIATSVRMPEKLTAAIDKFADDHSMSRSSAINYLLTKGLFHERLAAINNGTAELVERGLIDD